MSIPQTQYAEAGGLGVAYQVLGDGPIDVVCVPGFVSHLEVLWEEPHVARFFERVASFSRLILFDRRGQGLSDRLGAPPTLEQGMDDIHAVMDAAGSERAILLAVSEGGPMAILFGASFPQRVSGLILWGSFARALEADGYSAGASRELFSRLCDVVESDWGGPVLAQVFAPSRADDGRFLEWWARLLRHGSTPRGASELLRLYEDLDVRDVLPTIGAPALVLTRSGDRLTPVPMGRYIAEHIPGARFVELPGDDHLWAVGDAEATLGEIEEFVTGTRVEREVERLLATVLF